MTAVDAPAPAPSPRERRTARTRKAIVDAAHELFYERGYGETTIDEIADRADIAPRTFFRYFPSKEALVFADLDELTEELYVLLDKRPANEHPMRSLVVSLEGFADLVEANRDQFEWGFRIADAHPGVSDYALNVRKAQTAVRVTQFIADRLGVDPAVDPRPVAWTSCVMTMFSTALKTCVVSRSTQYAGTREQFLRLVEDTAVALRDAVPQTT